MSIDFEVLNGIVPSLEEIARRKEHVKRIIIEHPKYKMLAECIKEHHELSINSVQPDGLFLYGETGVGKSTLLKGYAAKYPKYVEEGITKVPILYFKVPVGATPKSVASALLFSLGDPNYDKGTGTTQTARILHFIEKCEVQMVIIDEFQHLIDRDTKGVLNRASDWVKSFSEDVRIPVILCGMPESEKIFRHNEQLDRRFCIKEELLSFEYFSKEDQIEFRTFLNVLDKQLPFANKSNLADPFLSEKLYYATNGVPSYIKTILENATVHAVKNGQDNIDELNLFQAFNKIKISKRKGLINPFCKDDFDLYEAIEEEKRKSI